MSNPFETGIYKPEGVEWDGKKPKYAGRKSRLLRAIAALTHGDLHLAADILEWEGLYELKLEVLNGVRSPSEAAECVSTLLGRVPHTPTRKRRYTGTVDLLGRVRTLHGRYERAAAYERKELDAGEYVAGERESMNRLRREFLEKRGPIRQCDGERCPVRSRSASHDGVRWEVDHTERLVERVERLRRTMKPTHGLDPNDGKWAPSSFYRSAFMDESNLQILCPSCHRLKTAGERSR